MTVDSWNLIFRVEVRPEKGSINGFLFVDSNNAFYAIHAFWDYSDTPCLNEYVALWRMTGRRDSAPFGVTWRDSSCFERIRRDSAILMTCRS